MSTITTGSPSATTPDGRPTTLVGGFHATVDRYPDRVALRTAGDAQQITWRQYRDRVRRISEGLHSLGVRRGDTVALMLTNRPEFHLCDTAVLMLGATPFSIYNTNPPEVVAYQFTNSDARVVITERATLETVTAAAEIYGEMEHIICLDESDEGLIGLDEVEAARSPDFDFEASWRAVQPQDLLTIVYTSGTTGPPKGVELTHANFIANSVIFDEIGDVGPDDHIVSYLPDAHAANRFMAHYSSILYGVGVTTVPDVDKMLDALAEARPTIFLGVPRLWVKVKNALEARLAENPKAAKARLGSWAINVGRRCARLRSEGARVGPLLHAQERLADRLVLSKIRSTLGFDRCRLALTGAAPLADQVHEFVLALGIPLSAGWGMSEATTGLTMQRPGNPRIGSVGTPLTGIELQIAEDGELLVRGDMVMRGYRKDPERTAETIDEGGWLHTGDIGEYDDWGQVRIIDRKKELIINSAGKNMSPSSIENAVAANTALAGFSVVIGDARPYNVMLICLDSDAVAGLAARIGVDPEDAQALSVHPQVRAEVQAGVDAANTTLSRTEQIKYFAIVPEMWEPGGECVTPTQKLRRKPIHERYAQLIDSLYTAGEQFP